MVAIKHKKVTGRPVALSDWDETHILTGTPGTVLGFGEDGTAVELGAAAGGTSIPGPKGDKGDTGPAGPAPDLTVYYTKEQVDAAIAAAIAGVQPAVTLAALSLSASSFTVGTATSGTIIGATSGSTITLSSGPTGFTINSGARTWNYDGTGSASTGNLSLSEAKAGATNTPRVTSIAFTVAAAPVVEPTAPVISRSSDANTTPFVLATDLNADHAAGMFLRTNFTTGSGTKDVNGFYTSGTSVVQQLLPGDFVVDGDGNGSITIAGFVQPEVGQTLRIQQRIEIDNGTETLNSAWSNEIVEVISIGPALGNSTAYRYYKVVIDSANSSNFAAFAEIYLKESTAGANLAPNATVTASSDGFGGVPSNLNNGNLSDYWHSASSTMPQSITLDFGSDSADWPKANVVGFSQRAGGGEWYQAPTAGKVQGSSDNSTFTDIFTFATADADTWNNAQITRYFNHPDVA